MAGRLGRLGSICRLAKAVGQAGQPELAAASGSASLIQQASPAAAALCAQWRGLQAPSSRGFASSSTTDLTNEIEHATGLEKQELEYTTKGVNPWHEDWLDSPFGTPENPVEVTSMFDHRVVGVPDPDDDSLVWWGIIEEGQPPKQIIEGGEYFTLKRVPGDDGHH